MGTSFEQSFKASADEDLGQLGWGGESSLFKTRIGAKFQAMWFDSDFGRSFVAESHEQPADAVEQVRQDFGHLLKSRADAFYPEQLDGTRYNPAKQPWQVPFGV